MLNNALIYLLAAVLAVPLAKRLGLGSVLGYLLAGAAIGPYALHLVGEQTDVMHAAEFGVVMMLFLIGLELRPARLWEMRKPILGLGGLQVFGTTALIAGLLLVIGVATQTALAVGLTLALSSTAIVIQSLKERDLLNSQAGNNAFSVLLFQDIAVIPILAVMPLLAVSTGVGSSDHDHSLIAHLTLWQQIAISLGTIAAIVFGGRYFSAPVFRHIAETHLKELFTAFALLIVVAITVLMNAIGLSAALGAFVAGVVLADSEFRHELETNIEPFKGLLLGLFFITVGASIDFPLLLEKPLLISALVIALVAIKFIALIGVCMVFKMRRRQALLFAVALAQGGEFAFVIVAAGMGTVFTPADGNLLIIVVTLSMLMAPLLLIAYELYMGRGSQKAEAKTDSKASEKIRPTGSVIVAGYGRFGQITSRLLAAYGFELTILDHSPSQIDLVRRFGNKVFYGDASRKDLLTAAGAKTADLIVVGVDEADKTLNIIRTVRKHFPHLKIVTRTTDRRHTYEVMKLGVDAYRRETFDSAVTLGVEALKLLGVADNQAKRAGQVFTEYDRENLKVLAKHWGDDKSYGIAMQRRTADLQQVLEADRAQFEALAAVLETPASDALDTTSKPATPNNTPPSPRL